jgi:hypothetical protein
MLRDELSAEQRELLLAILDQWIREKKEEISNTDDWRFRDDLKRRKELAISIIEPLDPSAAREHRLAS